MLKPAEIDPNATYFVQPPSGGCVLKPHAAFGLHEQPVPAAFGRLCVETNDSGYPIELRQPAAFGRLCVETICLRCKDDKSLPAAFGRLCVETI